MAAGVSPPAAGGVGSVAAAAAAAGVFISVEAGGMASGADGLGGGGPCCDAGTEK